jgi:hypothetical protein
VSGEDLRGNLQEAILGAHNGKYGETDPLSYNLSKNQQKRILSQYFLMTLTDERAQRR